MADIERRYNMIWVAFDENSGKVVKVMKNATGDPVGGTPIVEEPSDSLTTRLAGKKELARTRTEVIIHNSGCIIHGGVMYCW
jgi:hypothetical protein